VDPQPGEVVPGRSGGLRGLGSLRSLGPLGRLWLAERVLIERLLCDAKELAKVRHPGRASPRPSPLPARRPAAVTRGRADLRTLGEGEGWGHRAGLLPALPSSRKTASAIAAASCSASSSASGAAAPSAASSPASWRASSRRSTSAARVVSRPPGYGRREF